MSRCVLFECNKLHGFLRMNDFIDKKIIPCVRSKVLNDSTDLNKIKDNYFTIKVVKDINLSCTDCKTSNCDDCPEMEVLYQDFGLPIKIRAQKEDFVSWTNQQLKKDPNAIFYYYKSFETDSYGKLIISNDYYCIESINEADSSLIESKIFWKDDDIFNVIMNSFNQNQTDEILSYAKKIEKQMKTYLDFNYSIILNFAFLKEPYFTEDEFKNSNLLFYGLRTAYNKIDIEYAVVG